MAPLSLQLSLIIPTHKRPSSAKKCIQALLNLEAIRSSAAVEIILVSNLYEKSLDKFVQKISSSKIKYSFVGRVGVNAARNKGVQMAQGPLVGFLDDDCFVHDKKFVEKVLEFFSENPSVDVLGGRYGRPRLLGPSSVAYYIKTDQWLSSQEDNKNLKSSVVGGNVFYRAKIFQGPIRFSEKIKYGSSETEFNRRLLTMGYRFFYNPNLVVIHNCRIGFLTLLKKSYKQGRGWTLSEPTVFKRSLSSHRHSLKNAHLSYLEKVFLPIILYFFHLFFYLGCRAGIDKKESLGGPKSPLVDGLTEMAKDVGEILRLAWVFTNSVLLFPFYKVFWFFEYQLSKFRFIRKRMKKYGD